MTTSIHRMRYEFRDVTLYWFTPGEVVRLKSGGPDMTVKERWYGDRTRVPESDTAWKCQWFEFIGNHWVVKEGVFWGSTLGVVTAAN